MGGNWPRRSSAAVPTPCPTLPVLAAPFDVVGPPEPILAMVGEAAELPCELSSHESAARMELRWFREHVSPAVLAHRDGRAQDAEQMAAYRGRAELVQDDIAQGRVALRIRRVQASDDGEYRCFFRQNDRYGEASARLKVAGEHGGLASSGTPRAHIFPWVCLLGNPRIQSPRPFEVAGWGRPSGGQWARALAESGGSGDPRFL